MNSCMMMLRCLAEGENWGELRKSERVKGRDSLKKVDVRQREKEEYEENLKRPTPGFGLSSW